MQRILATLLVLVLLVPSLPGPAQAGFALQPPSVNAPAPGDRLGAGASPAPATITVDGVIDAAYGPPAATDSTADGNGNAVMNLVHLYIAEDATSY